MKAEPWVALAALVFLSSCVAFNMKELPGEAVGEGYRVAGGNSYGRQIPYVVLRHFEHEGKSAFCGLYLYMVQNQYLAPMGRHEVREEWSEAAEEHHQNFVKQGRIFQYGEYIASMNWLPFHEIAGEAQGLTKKDIGRIVRDLDLKAACAVSMATWTGVPFNGITLGRVVWHSYY